MSASNIESVRVADNKLSLRFDFKVAGPCADARRGEQGFELGGSKLAIVDGRPDGKKCSGVRGREEVGVHAAIFDAPRPGRGGDVVSQVTKAGRAVAGSG